jgi:hypothetical protein
MSFSAKTLYFLSSARNRFKQYCHVVFVPIQNEYKILQGAYKILEYFAKLNERRILSKEIVHTTFGSTSQEDYDVQIAVVTRTEPPQIPGHTNYARSVRQPFHSNTGLRFSREIAVATIEPFQMLRSPCVIDTNFTILRHFLLKLYAPCIFLYYSLDFSQTQSFHCLLTHS